MIRSRLGLLALCAMVLGVMAVSASAAQAAAQWLILDTNGTVLDAANLNASLGATIENEDAALLTHILGINVRILCKSANLINVKLIGEGKLSEGKVQFGGCLTFLNEVDNTSCKPHSKGAEPGTVETELGLGNIVLHELTGGTKDELTLIHPVVGTTFVTLEMEETCPIGSKVPVSGELFLKDCENAFLTHKVTHLIEQGPLTELWVLNKNKEHLETSIDGSANIFLTGATHTGLSWAGDPA